MLVMGAAVTGFNASIWMFSTAGSSSRSNTEGVVLAVVLVQLAQRESLRARKEASKAIDGPAEDEQETSTSGNEDDVEP